MNETAEVIEIKQEIIEFDITNMAIEKLKEKYSGMKIEPGNGKQYRAVKDAISDVRSRRISVEKRRKELKADALAFGRRVDSRAKDIAELLMPIESELKDIKAVEDDRKAAEKAFKAEVEQKRVDKIRELIHGLDKYTHDLNGMGSEDLKARWDEVKTTTIDIETYEEFKVEAEIDQRRVLNVLHDAYNARIEWEAEEAARQAEADRLEEQRVLQEKEAKRLQAEQDKIEADRKAEQERLDAERAKAEAKLQAERDELEAEKAAIAKVKADEEAKKQAEAARQAEADRQELERLKKIGEEQARLERKEADRIAEEERAKELAPDKDKLIDVEARLVAFSLPTCVSKEASDFIAYISDELNRLIEEIIDKTNAL